MKHRYNIRCCHGGLSQYLLWDHGVIMYSAKVYLQNYKRGNPELSFRMVWDTWTRGRIP